MEPLWNITPATENKLSRNAFVQTVGHDEGMYKAYEWTNNIMTIGLYYDRGYFDCKIMQRKEPRNSVPLIILLKYLNNDLCFYDEELEEAKLWNTLTTAQYFELFFCYYDKIKDFFKNCSIDSPKDIKFFFANKNVL